MLALPFGILWNSDSGSRDESAQHDEVATMINNDRMNGGEVDFLRLRGYHEKANSRALSQR